ncbi:Aquaporin-3 [Phytophthora nicotianae]|uniref:Aquaporin-3 n=1 Tax=Phytophthora nicotianae TaxID=4792 RepID=A0A0W8DLZ3_PHYNI|nr:Aquaporin-3 [Phytophthora nicotianae]
MSKRSFSPSKLPVTILTGFLGSGKTTLLNHLLTENHGKKFAIIENEFGEVGVDDQLIRQVTSPDDIGGGDSRSRKFNMGEEILTMNNGCICCSVRGDLTFDLDSILKRQPDFLQTDKEKSHEHSHGEHKHKHKTEGEQHHTGHKHKHSLVSSVGLSLPDPILVALLEEWIDDILETEGDDLLRYKGVVNVAGIDKKYVFQGVHTLFNGRFADNWAPGEKRETRFVFIGKNLDREALTEGFLACRATKDLRFRVGDRVMANTGDDGFQAGTIVQLWEQGNPYAIQLDSGRKIWAPVDEVGLVRALEVQQQEEKTRQPLAMVHILA